MIVTWVGLIKRWTIDYMSMVKLCALRFCLVHTVLYCYSILLLLLVVRGRDADEARRAERNGSRYKGGHKSLHTLHRARLDSAHANGNGSRSKGDHTGVRSTVFRNTR